MGLRRLKVLQILECGGPGGTGAQVAAICGLLDPARFETVLVYAVRPGADPEEFAASAGGVRAIPVPEMGREISPGRDLAAWLRLYRLFRQERPDIVHAHSSKAGFLARTAAWAIGVPKIYYSPRGYSFLQLDRSAASRGLYRALERSVSGIGETVAVSESEGELARGLGARVRVVPDAFLGEIPPAPARKDGEKRDLVVAACGRLSAPRNPVAFVKLCQRLTDSRNGVRCRWIGDGELGGLVREMLRDMNLAARVEVTGWLPHAEALRRLAEADIFIHFSLWEGLPNSVLDAMALGLPVLASDIPAHRELIRPGENGLLARTEVELLEKALELVDRPGLRAALGAEGQGLVRERYSRERLKAGLEALYGAAGGA